VSAFTAKLGAEVFNLNVLNVLEREKMDAILEEQKFSLSGCVSDECIIEVGQLLAVNFIVTGSLQRLENFYVIDLKMIDVSSGKRVSHVNTTWNGSFTELLSGFVAQVSNELITIYLDRQETDVLDIMTLKESPTGTVNLKISQADVLLILDGTASGKQPYREITLKLSPGKHTVRLMKEGFDDWEQEIAIMKNRTTMVEANLVSIAKVTQIIQSVKYGMVIIITNPENAEVVIDNVYLGQSPFQKQIDTGEHTVAITKTLYHSETFPFTVQGGEFYKKEVTLRPNFGTMKITTNPPGAQVFIGDQKIEDFTPMEILQLQSGRHTIKIRLNDYREWSRNILMADNQILPLQVNLVPAFGALEIESSPKAADMYLDGKYKGTTPLKIDKVYSGPHTLRLQKELYKSWETSINIEDAKTISINQKLEEDFGVLSFLSKPDGSKISIDDKYIGLTPLKDFRVAKGVHNIKIEKSNHNPIEKEIFTSVGSSVQITEDLEARTGNILIASTPSAAYVYVDKVFKGKTELKLEDIWAGKRKIRIEYPGYKPFQKEIEIPYQGTEFLSADLAKLVYAVPRLNALWRSAIIPGFGQVYSGRMKGLIYTLLTAGALNYTLEFRSDFRDQQKVYDIMLKQYRTSNSSSDVLAGLWQDVETEYSELKNINRKKQIAIGVTAAVWLWNMIDAYLFVPKIEESKSFSINTQTGYDGIRMELSFGF